MESKARILGHSAHQVLIVFPLGLLATAVIFDIVFLATGWPTAPLVAYWMIVSGVVGGLIAAPFGWIDWFAIPAATRAKRIGLIHGLVNVAVLCLFFGSWLLRSREYPDGVTPDAVALALSFTGAALAGLGGWLGGELVDRMGIGIAEGAHVNSPNSLGGKPARASVPARR
jgi:uncharacterized membrane protein